jgi:hypothetical protein
MNRIGALAREEDAQINPLERFSSNYFFKASSSV